MPVTAYDTTKEDVGQVERLLTDGWETEVLPRLPQDFSTQARRLKAFQRSRELISAADLLRGLLAYVLCAPSFRRVGAWAVLVGLADLSETAWRHWLCKASAWLEWLLGELLAGVSQPWLALQTAGRVLIVDASRLGQVGGTGDDWRLHCGYDLRGGRLVQVTVTDQHGAESLAYYQLQAGDTVVADNGYGYRRSVAELALAKAYGLFRITPSTFPLQDGHGQPIDVLGWLKQTDAQVRSLACACCYKGQTYAVRLIACQLSAEATAAGQRRKIRKAQKDGRKVSEETLFLAGWLLLITTLPAAQWSDQAVLQLYRARWQIELFFKRLKQLLRLSLLRCKRRASVQATIRLLLVAWALQQAVACELRDLLLSACQPLEQDRDLQVSGDDLPPPVDAAPQEEVLSSWRLCELCLETLRQQVHGQWSKPRLFACAPRLRRFLLGSPRRRIHQETQVRRWLAAPARGDPIVLQDVA